MMSIVASVKKSLRSFTVPTAMYSLGEKCQKGHKVLKANAAHVVVKVDDYFKGLGPATRILFCQQHPALEIDTFYKTDDLPMCTACAVSEHKSHNFMPLKDISLDLSAEINKALQPVRNPFLSLFSFFFKLTPIDKIGTSEGRESK